MSTDERGDARGAGVGGSCTIGSVEVPQGTTPTPLTPPTPRTSASPPSAPRSPSHGYWLVGSDGGIFTFGSAQFYGSTGALHLQRPVVGIVADG